MSIELQENMLVNTPFGFGIIIKVPTEPVPEPVISEEEQQKQTLPIPPPPPLQIEKQEQESDDPLPFPETLPFTPQVSTQTENVIPTKKKLPIIQKLTSDLKESIAQAKKLEQKYKYFYSNDNRAIDIALNINQQSDQVSQYVIHTKVKDISNVIFLLVKVFLGSRPYYLLTVPLNYTIEQIRDLIIEGLGQNIKMLHNIRIIHPIIPMKEYKTQSINYQSVDQYTKISDTSLRNYSQLIFMAQMIFTWDPIKKGKSITLSNNSLTCNKQGDSDYQTVLGTLAINSGKHYWEIRIDKYVDEEDIFIGIARKEIDLYTQPTTTGNFYGYICLCARKFGVDGAILNYGYSAKVNDIIGVLLEFRSGLGSLSFYRNGVKCGEAFNNLTGTFYPAVSMFYGEVQVTLDPRAPLPPN